MKTLGLEPTLETSQKLAHGLKNLMSEICLNWD